MATQYLKTGQDHKNFDSFKFLALLERDLPNHVACYHCERLHAIEHAKRHIYSNRYYIGRSTPQCWKANLRLSTERYVHWDFSFIVGDY
jgi:hypothetical protein